jgi:hypothetical protein
VNKTSSSVSGRRGLRKEDLIQKKTSDKMIGGFAKIRIFNGAEREVPGPEVAF